MIQTYFDSIRIKDWWNYILPPIAGFYGWGLFQSGRSFEDSFFTTVGFFLLTFGVASFGFFINEWTDIKDDLAAGKKNAVATLSISQQTAIFAFIVLQLLIGYRLCVTNLHTTLLLCIQLLSLLLYSCPPFRMKKNMYIAPILDALYSGTIFYLVAINIHYPTFFGLNISQQSALVLLTIWAIFRGFRNIIMHLLTDEKFDAAIAQKTAGTQFHRYSVERFLYRIILPVEVVAFAGFCFAERAAYGILLGVAYLIFMLYWWKRKTHIIPFILKRQSPADESSLYSINIFHEVALPVYIFGLLAVQTDPFYGLYLLLMLLIFPGIRQWIVSAIQLPLRILP